MNSDIKKTCFLGLVMLILISMACSASGSNGTWQASTSYSPYLSPSSTYNKIATVCDENLPFQLLFQEQLENGLTICCDIENNWIALDAHGNLLPSPPGPDSIPTLLEPSGDVFYIQTKSQQFFLYYMLDGTWYLNEILD